VKEDAITLGNCTPKDGIPTWECATLVMRLETITKPTYIVIITIFLKENLMGNPGDASPHLWMISFLNLLT